MNLVYNNHIIVYQYVFCVSDQKLLGNIPHMDESALELFTGHEHSTNTDEVPLHATDDADVDYQSYSDAITSKAELSAGQAQVVLDYSKCVVGGCTSSPVS